MLIGLKYKNRKINVDVKRCNLFWMVKGLMFTRREKARALLLFDFKKPRRMKIHSFFCSKFLAVWLDEENNIIEKRIVYSFNPFILPKKKFSRLVEIPCNSRYEDILKSLDEH
ncbi:hypothetical protein KAT80_02385 [Candidatus Pacearchaeota archaeon]|nr:hypothetical protein [Candidatus Pacearchaeota archaeon]